MRLACSGLSSWFEKKAVIVTPSRLLASVVSNQFTSRQIASGSRSWERPAIFSIDAWLTSCWQEARYSASKVPTLLSPPQERLLWHEIIEQEAPDLFDVGSTARLAMAAARVMAEWQIAPGGEAWEEYQDAQHFARWYNRFRQTCGERGWMTRPDVWRLLPTWLKQGWCEHQLTVFVGFNTTTPALAAVKQALGLWAVTEASSRPLPPERVSVQSCETFEDEFEWAARCVRSAFEQDTKQSLGVFVPELRSHLSQVQRTFEKVFYPGDAVRLIQQRERAPKDSGFHIHAADPIESMPVVASALLLLELTQDRIATANAAAMLRSPYIGGATRERSARALADLALRKRRDIDVSLRDIEYATRDCPVLAPVWWQVRNVLRKLAPAKDFASWGEFIRDLLEAVGWPGNDEPLSPEEQEAIELWKNAVSNLATLGMVSAPVAFATALQRLKGLLAGEAIETGSWSSPIQIMKAADATGISFDRAFLTGLSEEHWPPVERISPLIPVTLQRAHGIPGSSRQSAYEQRERLTSALFETAPSVAVTFSGHLSPLAERFVSREVESLPHWPGKLPIQSFAYVKLDEIEDSQAPPFTAVEPARGGTSVIRSQSLCPFRAFAEIRLLSNAPEEACIGFDSRDRGSFLHKALQFVWEELKTQSCLRSTGRDDLQKIVRDAVLRSVKEDLSSPFHQLATRAEWDRLENLVMKWLDVERERAQPFTVETLEEKRSYEIPGLRLGLRVDRMDRLANGSVLLIDYKSGKQTASKLDGERPAEPQLLVYAAAAGESVDGVFFGELTPRQPRAVGYGRTLQFEKRAVKKDWDRFIEQAKENVATIAQGFVEGNAAVDPLKGACDYCSQKPFCRVNEKTAGEGEDDDE